ncbi:caspase family protein [Streptomyces sp. NBC_01221]|uniref:caspase, EACC1-associated type n=1 Tax=Streptomyces sp. NBC_01221 TaxID=2903782 RepID=UPI0022580E5E|nr:caspase family protein [Streptomyces sp. NBC_01221]MCX4785449.1 caspase family protein [Streptomyces sp. NBC_01221]
MSLPDPDGTRVVLIGASEYQHFPDLPAVRNNLSRLAELFRSPRFGGLPAGHCATVLDPADAKEMLDAVHQAASEATDTLVVYFAGHGMRSPDGSLHLALRNSEQGRKLYESVPFDYLRAEVLDSMASRSVVILDCCYSGAALEGYMGAPEEFADQTSIEGTYVMTASAATQAAKAPVGAPLTSFTGELVKAVTDGVPGASDPLDMNSLYRHVRQLLESRGMPVPQQRAGGQGHAIALFRNQWIPPAEKPTLAAQREDWFREIREGLVWHLEDVPALGKGRLRNDLGEPALIRSLLVSRIAVQLARGKSTASIRDILTSSPVFAVPGPDADELNELIDKVQFGFEHDGLINTVVLDGLGLLPWSPESTYMLLIEYWAAQRGRTVPRTRVEQELSELWDTIDSRVLAAHSSLPSFPLEAYPDLWERLKAEPNFRVGNAGAMVLTQRGGGDQAWEWWMSTRPWSILKAGHLVGLGEDLVRCQAAQRALSRLLDQAPPGDDFRGVLERATKVIQGQLDHISLAVEGMSAIEYDLLRERSRDEHFQDGCLTTFQEHLLQRYQIFSPFYEHETTHGTWGPLPWWAIALHDEHERGAAEALLTRGGMQLSFTAKNHDTDELLITCWEPGPGPSGLTARLRFDLHDAVHACELLLLARRQSVTVDFLTEHIDEWDDREIHLIGTMNIAIDGEVGATLAEIATRALRRLVPGAAGPAIYHDGVPSLERLLKSSRPPRIYRHPR